MFYEYFSLSVNVHVYMFFYGVRKGELRELNKLCTINQFIEYVAAHPILGQ